MESEVTDETVMEAMDDELVEVGAVSDTRGAPGFNPDGGFGWQFFSAR